jgi:hypothetical protein
MLVSNAAEEAVDRLACLEHVRPSGKYQARMMPSESTRHDGFETRGKGFGNRGGNIFSKCSSTGPANPFGRGGKAFA